MYRDALTLRGHRRVSAQRLSTILLCASGKIQKIVIAMITAVVLIGYDDTWSLLRSLCRQKYSSASNKAKVHRCYQTFSELLSHTSDVDTASTHFTPHVRQLVNVTKTNDVDECGLKYHFVVSSPDHVPKVVMEARNVDFIARSWSKVLKRMFSKGNRTLPSNVTLGISSRDKHDPVRYGYGCYGSSAPAGRFAVTNFLEVKRSAINGTYDQLPWKDRSNITIWRGSPWAGVRKSLVNQMNESYPLLNQVLDQKSKTMRLPAVLFSRLHPELLDAKLSSTRGLEGNGWWENNATNGLYKLLPFDFISKDMYYSQHQSALVLGGIGASFRTAEHLSTGTAVLLQDYENEEWYIRFMQPFFHYIPLSSDLSDLKERLEWLRDNPTKVQAIGQNGKAFFEKFLSFEASEEFYHELLYRLALKEAR